VVVGAVVVGVVVVGVVVVVHNSVSNCVQVPTGAAVVVLAAR
jgi:hypothetical protein